MGISGLVTPQLKGISKREAIWCPRGVPIAPKQRFYGNQCLCRSHVDNMNHMRYCDIRKLAS